MATTTKHKKIRRNPERIRKMHKAGKSVSDIGQAVGCPLSTGQNRVRNLLAQVGLQQISPIK